MSLKLVMDNLKGKTETSLVKVQNSKGNWGTGFLIDHGFIITNCHCLPRLDNDLKKAVRLPDPAKPDDDRVELAIKRFNSRREEARAEVVYADPCGDIAILQGLDSQDFPEQHIRYYKLIDDMNPIQIYLKPLLRLKDDLDVYVRTVERVWLSGTAFIAGAYGGRTLAVHLHDKKARIPGGTSGSPVFKADGVVVGVLKIGSLRTAEYYALAMPDYLPVWLYNRLLGNGELTLAQRKKISLLGRK